MVDELATDERGGPPPTRVLLPDDHGLVRMAARQLLEAEPGIVVVGEADAEPTVALAQSTPADVVVLGISSPDANGAELVRSIRERWPGVAVVALLGPAARPRASEMIDAGLSACLETTQHGADLPLVVRAVRAGYSLTASRTEPVDSPAPPRPTHRQMEILRLVERGLTNRQVARELGITERTVESHLHALFAQLGVGSRTELIHQARQQDLLRDNT